MGFSHYWRKEGKINQKQYADALKDIAKIVKAKSDILAGPMGEAGTKPELTDGIAFNGIDNLSHESFALPKTIEGDFDFCKTNQKPYDEVVVAALARLAEVDGIKVSSDGSAADWDDGVKLASKVLGRKVHNPLGLRLVKSFAEKIKAKYAIGIKAGSELKEGDWSQQHILTSQGLLGLDTSIHTNDGYKLVKVPNRIQRALRSVDLIKKIEDIILSGDEWIVSLNNGVFEVRYRDFEKFVESGLSGVRVDTNQTIIYFAAPKGPDAD